MVVEEKAGARLPRYARLLGASRGRARREAAEAARACLEAMRFRFPEALHLVELVIRLGEVGAFDLAGSVKQIAEMIGEILGEPPPDPVKLQRAMRSLDGRTCLVENLSRQRWRLCLAGISDPASDRHRLLLKETPSLYRLDAAPEPGPDQYDAEAEAEIALRRRLEETVSKLHNAEAGRDAARAAQADLEKQLHGVRADFARLGSQNAVLRRERDDAEAQRAALETERDALAQRVRDQDTDLAELRAELAARDRELLAERERRRLADEARAGDVEALEEATRAQAAAATDHRQLEEAVLERDVALEDADRRLAALRTEIERIDAAANARLQAADSAAAEEAKRSAGLKAILKDERERRRATETRLRRLLVALRRKLVGDDVTDIELERDEVCLAEIRRIAEEHVHAKDDEREALARETEHEEDLDQIDQDARLGRMLGRLLTQLIDEETAQPDR